MLPNNNNEQDFIPVSYISCSFIKVYAKRNAIKTKGLIIPTLYMYM